MKTIIFDFDWVIHDTFSFHLNKIKEFFKIDLSEENYRQLHDWNLFNANSPEPIKTIWWEKYIDFIYPEIIKLKIDKKVKESLVKLGNKYRLNIVSSWWTKNVVDYLKNNNIFQLFDEILCYEFNKSKVYKFNHIFEKYNYLKEDCIFVTDTLWDVFEANELWLKTIAVDFWYHQKERLEKWNPYKIISDFSELLTI